MATRRQLEAEIARHGASIDYANEDANAFTIDSPQFTVWKSIGTHGILCVHRNNGGQSWKPQAYDAAIEDMSMGVQPCDIAESCGWCDICDEDREAAAEDGKCNS